MQTEKVTFRLVFSELLLVLLIRASKIVQRNAIVVRVLLLLPLLALGAIFPVI